MVVSSIFNDVIGPVMRGPSSSHSAAGCRIGLLLRDLIDGEIEKVEIDYDYNGALVTTHESQGTDMGLYGGLLGWQAHDERMVRYRKSIQDAGISIQVNYVNSDAKHPNTYKLNVSNAHISHEMIAISTGGGMIEVQEIDGAQVSMNGDYHELLIYCNHLNAVQSAIPQALTFDSIELHNGNKNFIELKSHEEFSKQQIELIEAISGVEFIRYIHPVLPVLSYKDLSVPFLDCDTMLAYSENENLELWELGMRYESARGRITEDEVFEKMRVIAKIMDESIKKGLEGTNYDDRILPCQSLGFRENMNAGSLLDGGILNTIILNVTSMMEMKSSLGIIVAAPTAGSCGVIPGALLGAAHQMGMAEDDIVKALLAAGMIGIFISEHSTFSAEVGGCQAECGAASSMTAAGLVTLARGTLKQCITAASLSLQNSLGMICDPIGNRVEAPCLGKNVMAASNALSCANMALSNYDPVVTFDEVVKTMFEVGKSLPHELRCTALGGLSITESSKKVEEHLKKFKSC